MPHSSLHDPQFLGGGKKKFLALDGLNEENWT
jgi:hypothetical protein